MIRIKDKKKITLIAICAAVLISFSVYFAVNMVISQMHNRAIYCSNVALMWEHIADDEEFAQKYGEPVSYKYKYDPGVFYTNLIDDGRQASFYVTVKSGTKYLVTVSWKCREDKDSVFSYVEIKENSSLFGD